MNIKRIYTKYSTNFANKNNDISKCKPLLDKIVDKSAKYFNIHLKWYFDKKLYNDVLIMFFKIDNHVKDGITCNIALNACIKMKNKQDGDRICQYIIESGFKNNIRLSNTFLNYYGKMNTIQDTIQFFKNMDYNFKNIVTYCIMMNIYNECHMYQQCIQLFLSNEMKSINKNVVSYIIVLKALIFSKDKEHFNHVYCEIKAKQLDTDIKIKNLLIYYYGIIQDMDNATLIYNSISRKETATRNIMMKICAINNLYTKVLHIFNESDLNDSISFNISLNACIHLNNIKEGESILKKIKNCKYNDIELKNTVLKFYGFCIRNVHRCERIFGSITNKDVIVYNTMLNIYNDNHLYDKSLFLFDKMMKHNIGNYVSYMHGLNACIMGNNINQGKYICARINCKEYNNIELLTTVINFYGNNGYLKECEYIYQNNIKDKDIKLYSVMMNMYRINNRPNKAIELFKQIKGNNIKLDEYIYGILFLCCADSISKTFGMATYNDMHGNSDLKNIYNSPYVKAALITMFGKFNNITKSIGIFNDIMNDQTAKLSNNDKLLLYQSLMDVYCKISEIDQVLLLYEKLKQETDIVITNNIYCIIINAYSNAGKINKAINIFNKVNAKDKYIIASIIDALSHCGYINTSIKIFNKYSSMINFNSKIMILHSMLNSCSIYNDITNAEYIVNVTEKVCNHHNQDINASFYIALSIIYAKNKNYVMEHQTRARASINDKKNHKIATKLVK